MNLTWIEQRKDCIINSPEQHTAANHASNFFPLSRALYHYRGLRTGIFHRIQEMKMEVKILSRQTRIISLEIKET